MEYKCRLSSAQEFAKAGRLEDWVHAYLLSDGNNQPFSDGLKQFERTFLGPVKMPLKFVIEMFCDRVAACKIYRGKNYTDSAALDYFLNAKKRRVIHKETTDFLEMLLRMLAEKGEDETFSYIKNLVKTTKDY